MGALAVDALVLGAIGLPLGHLLGERFAPVGTPARLIGLLVIVPEEAPREEEAISARARSRR